MHPRAQMPCGQRKTCTTASDKHPQAPCTAAAHGPARRTLPHARPHKGSTHREIHKHTATLNTSTPHCPTPPLANTTCHTTRQVGPTDPADRPATTPHTPPEDTPRHNAIHNLTTQHPLGVGPQAAAGRERGGPRREHAPPHNTNGPLTEWHTALHIPAQRPERDTPHTDTRNSTHSAGCDPMQEAQIGSLLQQHGDTLTSHSVTHCSPDTRLAPGTPRWGEHGDITPLLSRVLCHAETWARQPQGNETRTDVPGNTLTQPTQTHPETPNHTHRHSQGQKHSPCRGPALGHTWLSPGETDPGTLRRHTRVCSEKLLLLGTPGAELCPWHLPPSGLARVPVCLSLAGSQGLPSSASPGLSSSRNLWVHFYFCLLSFSVSVFLSFDALVSFYLSVSVSLSVSDSLCPFVPRLSLLFISLSLPPSALCLCVSLSISVSVFVLVSLSVFLYSRSLPLSLCPHVPLCAYRCLCLCVCLFPSLSLLFSVSFSLCLCLLLTLGSPSVHVRSSVSLPVFSSSTPPHSGAEDQRHRDCPRESEPRTETSSTSPSTAVPQGRHQGN